MYSLWKVKRKNFRGKTETWQFAEDSIHDVDSLKKAIKYHMWKDEFDLRTLKRTKFPKGEFQCTDLSEEMRYIFFDGELMVSWDDTASYNYPEDLTWSRTIADLIEDARKLERLKITERLKNESK